jgi:hypothetical protein
LGCCKRIDPCTAYVTRIRHHHIIASAIPILPMKYAKGIDGHRCAVLKGRHPLAIGLSKEDFVSSLTIPSSLRNLEVMPIIMLPTENANMNTIPISISYQDMLLTGYADPVESFEETVPSSLVIFIQGRCLGTLQYRNHQWSMDKPIDPFFIESLGAYICSYIKSLKKALNEHS